VAFPLLFLFRNVVPFVQPVKVEFLEKKELGESKGSQVFQAKSVASLKVSLKSGVRCGSTDRKLAQEQAKAYRSAETRGHVSQP
jgi:hypothetical protein